MRALYSGELFKIPSDTTFFFRSQTHNNPFFGYINNSTSGPRFFMIGVLVLSSIR